MTRAALGFCFTILMAAPATADGPPLAHLTLNDRTITLTSTDQLPPVVADGTLALNFAQRHLGFPLPPFLAVTLQRDGDTWSLTAIALERGLGEHPVAFGTAGLQLSHDGPESTQFVIEGNGLAPGAQMVPFHLEITLTSP